MESEESCGAVVSLGVFDLQRALPDCAIRARGRGQSAQFSIPAGSLQLHAHFGGLLAGMTPLIHPPYNKMPD